MPFVVEDLMAATFTPMKDNGDINLAAIDKYQKHLKDQGVNYVYVNGSTGEGTSLTFQERKGIAQKWMELSRIPGREMKVVLQIGGTNFKETIELTKQAATLGADAISTQAPLYFTPPTVDALVEYCKRIGENAPNVPFYYYHFPDRTGVNLSMEEFLIKCRQAVPSLRGIKFTSKDIYEGTKCLRTLDANGDRYDLLYGYDEQMLPAMVMGFKGAVGSTVSIIPNVYKQAIQALKEGNIQLAREHQYKSIDFIRICFNYGRTMTGGPLPVFKAVLREIGVDVGPPRFPMDTLDATKLAQLMAQLKEIGFHQWCKK